MRSILPVLCLVLACAGCNLVGASVGAGSNSGMAVSFSSYGDFLYSGPSKAYASNKRGLTLFMNKDYPAAREAFEGTLKEYPRQPGRHLLSRSDPNLSRPARHRIRHARQVP